MTFIINLEVPILLARLLCPQSFTKEVNLNYLALHIHFGPHSEHTPSGL